VETGEPLNQQSHLVKLTGMVLAYVIMQAETPVFHVMSHPVLGTRIVVKDQVFEGKDELQVVGEFLTWILKQVPKMTPEEYAAVADRMETDPEDIDGLAEQFAEGGMSEFGKAVETARRQGLDVVEEATSDATGTVGASSDKPN